MKTLILYYSNSGNTERLARRIQQDIPSDMIKVEPAEKYGCFAKAVHRMIKERKSHTAVALKTPVPDLSSYDVIFVGYPIWASTLPDFMREFLSRCDFRDKKVIPFSTSYGASTESSLKDLKVACEGARVGLPLTFAKFHKDDYGKWLEKVHNILA